MIRRPEDPDLDLEDGLSRVVPLMIAGRFQRKKPGTKASRRVHAVFEFSQGESNVRTSTAARFV